MNKAETAKLFAVIAALYPRDASFAKADRAMLEAWNAMLADVSFGMAQAAVQAHAASSPFPPSISEIRCRAVELTAPSRPVDEAWQIALHTIRTVGSSQYDFFHVGADGEPVWETHAARAKRTTPPDVWAVMERMGYRDMCTSDNIDVLRSQFIKLWEITAKRERETAALPPSIRKTLAKLPDHLSEVDLNSDIN